MCIAIPMKVIKVEENWAVCEYEGIRKTARLDLVKDIKVGDYVLIHVGFVIQKIDLEEAYKTLQLYKELKNI
ncbi:MAG: HypC/HybG/HupF family hydrogenase formation chaperone [Endomicrobiia bacterium]